MKASDALSLAGQVVLNGWGKDGYALNKDGRRVHIMADDAVQFCAVGALARVLGGSVKEADEILNAWIVDKKLLPRRSGLVEQTVRNWNDVVANSKEEVAKLFEDAAAGAREAGQ